MAYQTRQRDPLLDDQTHAALMRLGQQATGFALLGSAAALVALLLSYAPDDPNFMAATDAVPQNLLGRFGASVAAILMMIMGYGALLLPVVAAAWGVRFLLQSGHERVMGRALFIPIAVALTSIFAASFAPGEDWTHSFGLGGLFGDTILGAVLNAMPMAPESGLRVLSVLAFPAAILLSLFVVGVSRAEFGWGLRFLILGLLAVGAMVSTGLRSAGQGPGEPRPIWPRAAPPCVKPVPKLRASAPPLVPQRGREVPIRRAEAAAPRSMAPDPALHSVPILHDDEEDAVLPVRRTSGLLARMPLLRPREPEPQQVMTPPAAPAAPVLDPTARIAPPDEDQIRARITDVIKSRVRRPNSVAEAAARRRGVLPGAAPLRPVAPPVSANPAQRVEPPLTAAHRPQATVIPTPAPAPVTYAAPFEEEEDLENLFLDDDGPEAALAAPVACDLQPAANRIAAPGDATRRRAQACDLETGAGRCPAVAAAPSQTRADL